MTVKFEDYSPQVKARMLTAIRAFMYEAGGEVQGQVARNTRVDTGRTKGSWDYKVSGDGLEVTVGSNAENAIWEEYGTGIHAEGGRGRQTPWSYRAPNGKWYTTRGKKGTKAFRRAYGKVKRAAAKNLERKLSSYL